MNDLFLIIFLVSTITLIVGLVKPTLLSRFMKGEVTRKRISKIFGVATILSFVLFSLTIPPTSDETVIIDPPIVTPPVTGDIYENINTTEEKKIDTNPTPSTVEIKNISTTTPETTSSESNVTVSQKNAVIKAKSYLGYSAFSYNGLITQLEFEQFSHADAVYGADNSGADWNEQAAKKAKAYLDYSAFSRASLIEQLKFEKFTQAQAEYGADAVGL